MLPKRHIPHSLEEFREHVQDEEYTSKDFFEVEVNEFEGKRGTIDSCDALNHGGSVDQLSTCGIPVGIAYLDTILSCLIHRDSFRSKGSPTGPFQPYSEYYQRLWHNSP